MSEDATFKEVLELHVAQMQKLEGLSGSVQETTGAVKELAVRTEHVEGQVKRMQGSLDTVITQYHEVTSVLAGLDQRSATHGKRISEEHRKLGDVTLAVVDIQKNCVRHEGTTKMLVDSMAETNKSLDEHKDELKKHKEKLTNLNGATQRFTVQVKQTWRTLAIAGGAAVTAVGIFIAILSALGKLS